MVKRGNRLIAMAMALMISLVSSGSALTAYATEMVPGTEAVVENGISTEGEPIIDNPFDEDPVISDPIPRDENNFIKDSTSADVVFDTFGFLYIKNQIIFMTYLGTDKRIIEKLASDMDADIVGYIQSICFYQIEFRSNKSCEELEEFVELIEGHSYIMYADLNYVEEESQVNYFSNDTLYNDGATCKNAYTDLNGNGKSSDYGEVSVTLDNTKADTNSVVNPAGDNWGLEAMNVPGAWDYLDSFPSNKKVKVGVLDNMFGSHQDLNAQLVKRYNNPTVIDSIHGTHVSGIIGAGFDNNIGISGVATNVEIYGYSIANVNTKAKKATCLNTIIDIEKAKAINISYGYLDGIIYSASHGDTDAQKWIYKENKEICSILTNLLLKGNDFLILQAAGNSNDAKVVKNTGSTGYTYINYDDTLHQGWHTYSGGTDPYYNFWTTAITDELVSSHIVVVGAVKTKKSYGTTYYEVTDFTNIGNRVDIYAPGYEILSTVPVTSVNIGYQLANGTSMATPYITGLAALIWQANPDLTALQVKRIMLENHGHEVLDASGATLTKSNGEVYYIPDAEKCVKKALSTYGVDWVHPELPSGTVQGKVVDVNNNPIAGIKVMFIRTSAGQSNLDEYWFVEETDANGNYEKLLPQGTYEIIISDENTVYVPYCIKNIEVLPDQVKILDTIIMEETSWMLAVTDGKVQGSVYNALNGKAVAGANIIPRTGWNNLEGPNLLEVYCYGETVTSDSNGNFDLTLPIGHYTLEISKDGYIVGYYNVVSQSDDGVRRMSYVLTPVMSEGEYRIILTWGSTPRDLDSHLTYYETGSMSRAMHVYYSNKKGYIDGVKVAELDLDDTNGYGPETVTLTIDSSVLTGSDYFRYSVHDFTNGGSAGSSSRALSNSGAVVRVYTNNELLETYNVPTGRNGNVWQVFALSSSGLQTLGSFKTKSASEVE